MKRTALFAALAVVALMLVGGATPASANHTCVYPYDEYRDFGAGADTVDDRTDGVDERNCWDGGPGGDSLHGFEKNDEIYGGDAVDFLEGGNDKDHIFGQANADDVRGDDGDDEVRGGLNDDYVYGGPGDDALYDGPGDDVMTGNSGTDTWYNCPDGATVEANEAANAAGIATTVTSSTYC